MAVATRLAAKFNSYYAERPGKILLLLESSFGQVANVLELCSSDHDGH